MKKLSGTMVAIMAVAILIGTFITTTYATAGEKARDGRFIAYDNGTVLDTKTKLIWSAKDNGSVINWADAKSYCENYRGGGYADWRMPTQDELAGLYEKDKTNDSVSGQAIHLTKLISLTSFIVWGSDMNSGRYAGISFRRGRVMLLWLPPSSISDCSVLPVRSGK